MENQTPFDLNERIQVWGEQLSQSPAFQRENLEELEAHLRDSIRSLQARGLSEEEAFMVAIKRLGADGLLAIEYGKVNRQAVWVDRMLWMLIGLQLWGVVLGILNTFARTISIFALSNMGNINAAHGIVFPIVILTSIQLLALTGSLAICWWLVVRRGQYFETWISRFFQRRVSRIAIFGFLTVLTIGLLLPYGLNMLQARFAYPYMQMHGHYEVMGAQAYSSWLLIICHAATLLTLTVILARKRLKPGQAA